MVVSEWCGWVGWSLRNCPRPPGRSNTNGRRVRPGRQETLGMTKQGFFGGFLPVFFRSRNQQRLLSGGGSQAAASSAGSAGPATATTAAAAASATTAATAVAAAAAAANTHAGGACAGSNVNGVSTALRKRRESSESTGSDGSTLGYAMATPSTWYIAGRTANGQEKFYQLQPSRRYKSFDRVSI